MLTFKIADRPDEIEQLQALHYKTFVEEIPQHHANDARRHVDRFHGENVYIISLKQGAVVGSLAVRARRPFSLDHKLPDLDRYLPSDRRVCEVRLLSIEKEHRTGAVLPGILSTFHDYAMDEHFDCAVISATTRQLKLYGQLGFEPFGPLVGTEQAPFQPMIVTLERFRDALRRLTALPPAMRGEVASFLPGPVAVHPDVATAFHSSPLSHRSQAFRAHLHAVQTALTTMTNAQHAAVLLGSGTLANDLVAAQLSRAGGRGLVLSNGEFGERLADHATRFNLSFEHVSHEWGATLDLTVDRTPDWIWLTACETSTGMLNDLAAVQRRWPDARLCVDAVSAIGAVPLDFSRVWLATGASGKALGSYPGLSFVFHNHDVPAGGLPRYLDLGLYGADDVPFTHSSNLVHALRVALERVDWPRRYAELARTGRWLRARLGNTLPGSAPHVITIPVDDAVAVAAALEKRGFVVAHASGYLQQRNWVQIAVMGEVTRAQLAGVARELARVVTSRSSPPPAH